jgi:hypothetical protein
MQTNQMNGLYPIIRRVRRPLLPVEALADGHQAGRTTANAKPVVAAAAAAHATAAPEQTGGAEPEETKHGEITSSVPAK